jgi:hypothetical protein
MIRGVRWLIVALAACATAPRPPVPVADPIGGTEDREIEVPTTRPEDPRAVKRAEIVRELEAVDREIEAIDEELAAGVVPGPATRDDALVLIAVRAQMLARTAPDTLFEDTPLLLVRIANQYFAARERDGELAETLGERHPDRVEARRVIDALRAAFDRQRDVELALLDLWRDELGKLAKTASHLKVRQANRRALQLAIARSIVGSAADGFVPSESPADLRVAAARVVEARGKLDGAAHTLGPKHPDMVVLQNELAAARDALSAAVAQADTRLAAELAAPDARVVVKATGTANLARRAELATRARDLRREWDALR